jgi:hypothetical protein
MCGWEARTAISYSNQPTFRGNRRNEVGSLRRVAHPEVQLNGWCT